MTNDPPPLVLTVPLAVMAGAVLGVFGASFYLTWVLGLDLQTTDLLLVARLPAEDREIHADEVRIAYAGVVSLAVLSGVLAWATSFRRRLTTYGDAHWQSRREMGRNGLLGQPGGGFVCAKLGDPKTGAPYVVAEDRPHVMMVAPTRAGKGVGFVIPNLLSFRGSAVTLDVKGELYRATARWRGRDGAVHRFAPFDWKEPGARYNPLARVAELPSREQRYTAVEKLANLFLDRDNRQNDTFSEAGKSIFVAACLRALDRGTPTLGAVREIVLEGQNKKKQYFGYALEAAEAGDDTERLLWMEASSTSERLLTSNIQALQTGGFRAWNNPAVRRATDVSDFDFSTFRSERQSLYLCVDEDDIEALAPLLRMMFGELIATLRHHEPGEGEPHPVMVMLDEFQQMGAMPYLERAIHTLASYGGRVAIIAQSLASLDRIYGPEGREGFEAGAALKLYIQPREGRTVAEVSRAVGSCTREAVTRSYGVMRGLGGLRGQSVREEERPLLSETEARTLDPDDVIVLVAPLMPVRARRIQHFADPTFAGMMKAQERMSWPEAPEEKDETPEPEPERAKATAEPSQEDAGGTQAPPAGGAVEAASPPGHGFRITRTTPRETVLPEEVIETIRQMDARITELLAEVAELRRARDEDRPWWEMHRDPAPPAPAPVRASPHQAAQPAAAVQPLRLPSPRHGAAPAAAAQGQVKPSAVVPARSPQAEAAPGEDEQAHLDAAEMGQADAAPSEAVPAEAAPGQDAHAETGKKAASVRASALLRLEPRESGPS